MTKRRATTRARAKRAIKMENRLKVLDAHVASLRRTMGRLLKALPATLQSIVSSQRTLAHMNTTMRTLAKEQVALRRTVERRGW
jgi:hypothetical protein